MGSIFGGGGKREARAAREASEIQADAQREALAYMQEREEIPIELRDKALTGLGEMYLGDDPAVQQALIDKAEASPLYGAIMGGREAGEEAIMRQASATGGLRSGNVQHALYDYNTELQNQALLQSYGQQLSGIHGLAELPQNTGGIAGAMQGIGRTQAQGVTASAQARSMGRQQRTSNIMDAAGLAATIFTSDIRLKTNIKPAGKRNGHNWYTWIWNKAGEKLGLVGDAEGVMAHEVFEKNPRAVFEIDGYIAVDHAALGVTNA